VESWDEEVRRAREVAAEMVPRVAVARGLLACATDPAARSAVWRGVLYAVGMLYPELVDELSVTGDEGGGEDTDGGREAGEEERDDP
jgi:hypothetical protein